MHIEISTLKHVERMINDKYESDNRQVPLGKTSVFQYPQMSLYQRQKAEQEKQNIEITTKNTLLAWIHGKPTIAGGIMFFELFYHNYINIVG